MVAYAFAAQFPQATERVVLMDAFLPGIGNWKDVWLLRDLWHFHFYGEVPLALVQGRERIYFEHFWNDFAADPKHSVPEADRRIYAAAYAQPGGMRAGFEYFRSLERDAQVFAQLARTRLAMPMLVLTGEKASGAFLIEQAKAGGVRRPRGRDQGLGALADGRSPGGGDAGPHRLRRLNGAARDPPGLL